MKTKETIAQLTEKDPDAKLHGFYWRDPSTKEFCVVVLGTRKRAPSVAEEFRGETPEALIAAAEESNATLGTPGDVRRLCETAPRWLNRSRRRAAAPPQGEGGVTPEAKERG